MAKEIQHISGSAGGYLVGNSHANGGIQAINKAVGKPLEMEGGEVVITKPAVDDNQKREFEGEMLTNREILSRINVSGGGVSFAEKGALLPTHIEFYGNTYKYGGETITDYEIAHRISKCGCSHEKETFADGGQVDYWLAKQEQFKDQNIAFQKIENLILKELENRGLDSEYIYTSKSQTDYGQSWYIKFKNDLEVRISDHSLQSMNRIFDQKYVDLINIYATYEPEMAVNTVDRYVEKSKQIEEKQNSRIEAENKFEERRLYILEKSKDFLNELNSENKAIFYHGFTRITAEQFPIKYPHTELILQLKSGNGGFEYYYVQPSNGFGLKYVPVEYFNYLVEIGKIDAEKVEEKITFANGGLLSDSEKLDLYEEWKKLVNMSAIDLQSYYDSSEGKNSGLSASEAKKQGIKSGRESAKWIIKMKNTNVDNWTPWMWEWAKRQVSFIKRMTGFPGELYDENGTKTRKHKALLIWGHNPEKYEQGGNLKKELNLNPKNSIELKQSLEIALEIEDDNQKKKTLEQLQVDFFTNIVAENPKKELTNYYEAISILPKNKRQYFEYWFSEQESESFQEKLKDNPYNFLPSDLKPEIKIKKLDFSPTPESENLGKIMNIFTGDDALRPKFSGVFFNVKEERIEATDAHKLMFINEKPHLSESMICLMGKRKEKHLKNSNPNLEKNSEGCWRVDESYVNTSAIIPTDFNSVIEINAKKLLQYLEASEYFSNPVTHQVILCYQYEDKPIYVGFNSDFLADCLKGMLMLGHSDLEMCFMEAKNRAVVIVPKGNSRKVSGYALKTDLTLCMPIRLSSINDYLPIYDIENNIATIIGKYENHIEENEDDLEFVPEINQFQENKKEVDKMVEAETINIQDTIDGLEILLETAKGKNKTNLIETIEGLKFVLESAKYEDGGQTEVLLAPNGKPSNLNSVQWNLVRTTEFKNWFGDWENSPETSSKVVDENGEPLIVYHATQNEFFEFSKEHLGKSIDFGTIGSGFYFTSSKENANNYARNLPSNTGNNEKGRLMNCFLNLRKIKEINSPTMFSGLNQKESKKFTEKISKSFDGMKVELYFSSSDRFYWYVAFEPNQIKLADGTNTIFNPETNDIRYDKGGSIENDNLAFRPITTPLN